MPASRRFLLALAGILVIAATLRGLFLTADPPWRAPVGIVWHDEGAWVHNARNRVLFGAWQLDAWNPVYITPVFTGLEYLTFRAVGVGLWQARLVSVVAGVAAVVLLGLALRRLGGNLAGMIGAGLLATNYVWVMYNRAALMESTMIALIVASFYALARAPSAPGWAFAAGALAIAAFFAKATAAFYVAALGVAAGWTVVESWWRSPHPRTVRREPAGRVALLALAGLAVAGSCALVLFVAPNWAEYRFYNWQMSVTRRPSYTLRALADRVTWLPIIHDLFTRMWLVTVTGILGAIGLAVRWRAESLAVRVLVLWLGLGVLELIVRDVGNERYLVYLIPALVATTALALGRGGLWSDAASVSRTRALFAIPVLLLAAYVVIGSMLRLAFLQEISPSVRLSAAVATLLVATLYATWPRVPRWLARQHIPTGAAVALTGLVAAGDLVQYGQWAVGRTHDNYEASVELGRRLAPGTLVHGKLANGLALENGIRPIFVGRGFGNYDDRLRRDDIRYLLTYLSPRPGYEGPVILDVLRAYPAYRVLWTFDVRETRGGHDRAALIDKNPAGRGRATTTSP